MAGKCAGSAVRAYRAAVLGPYSLYSNELAEWFGGEESESGIEVTPDRAMQLSAVYACIQVLSQSIAQLPLFLYQRSSSGPQKKSRAVEHPLYTLLHDRVNPQMTSYQFRQMAQAHAAMRGNCYSYIERDRATRIRALWPWPQSHVRVEADGWRLRYYFRVKGGGEREIPARNVLHIRGLSLDGLMGLSPIAAARETLAAGIGAQRYGARFFKKGAAPPFVLMSERALKPEARTNLGKSFAKKFGGVDKAYEEVPVLEQGVKVETVGISPQDAQFLESRELNREEIASIFRVPAHMINDLKRATFNNIEHMSLHFVMHTLGPWMQNWEQQMNLDLLDDSERKEFYFEFNADGLLRGDVMARWMAYRSAINWGVLNANEVRDLENMNPRAGGDVYLMPGNMEPSGSGGKKPGKGSPSPVDGDGETKNCLNPDYKSQPAGAVLLDSPDFLDKGVAPAAPGNRILGANGKVVPPRAQG